MVAGGGTASHDTVISSGGDDNRRRRIHHLNSLYASAAIRAGIGSLPCSCDDRCLRARPWSDDVREFYARADYMCQRQWLVRVRRSRRCAALDRLVIRTGDGRRVVSVILTSAVSVAVFPVLSVTVNVTHMTRNTRRCT